MGSISQFQYLQMLGRTAPKGASPKVPLGPGPDRESDLHDEILADCTSKGWLAIHSRMDKKSTQALGVSDFIIVTATTVYFIEAKRIGQKPTTAQLGFLAHARKLGWPAAVVHTIEEYREAVKYGHP